MAVANGRIATSNLSPLPLPYSNKREQEYLTKPAYASLSRMMLRAVAGTRNYFSVWDAYRSFDEQVAMLKKNYYPSSSGDRSYGGQKWAQRSGRPRTASPGHSNHGNGVAVDIHPGPIQAWLKANAARFGWVNDVPSEPWHWSYLNPRADQYRSEGVPDVAGMQKRLGVKADGKFGPATSKAVRAWQKENGLTADGIPGAKTMGAILGKAVADVIEDAIEDVSVTPETPAAVPGWMPGADRSQTFSGNPHKATVTKIVLHTTEGSSWPGYGGGGSAPHVTVKPGAATSENIRQHIASTEAAKALVNKRGGVETNNAGVFQIEFVGSCDKDYAEEHGLFFTEDATDDDLAGLAAVVAWAAEAHGVPMTVEGLSWPTTNAAYASAPQRLSGAAWEGYTGLLGHTHVPENDHWDPGAFPVERLLALAGGAAPAAKPPISTNLPAGKDLLMELKNLPDFPLLRTPGNKCYYGPAGGEINSVSGKNPNSLHPGEIFGSGISSGAHGLKAWQKQMGIEADGRFGDGTEKTARALQKRTGLLVDGKIGPTTFYAAYLVG